MLSFTAFSSRKEVIEMRKHKCKRCGTIYETTGAGSAYCPECAAELRKTGVIRDRVCTVCGKTYQGFPRSKYCPECRADVVKQQASARRAAGKSKRPIGSMDLCAACGKPYMVKGPMQRYCPDCAKTVVADNVRAQKRDYYAEHKEQANPIRYKKRKFGKVCVICGAPILDHSPTTTCSEECAAKLKKLYSQKAEAKRAGTRNRKKDSGE